MPRLDPVRSATKEGWVERFGSTLKCALGYLSGSFTNSRLMKSFRYSRLLLAVCSLAWISTSLIAETVKDREGAVRGDKAKMENDARWLYNDLESGFAEAKRTNKPLLVVLRCVPCLACAGIDGAVMDAPLLGPLLDEFVCVRLINANALDLTKFQFDYDVSFSAMIFAGYGTVIGRFGSWTHQKDPSEKSVDGFKATLDAALLLHRGYPGNAANLAGKQPVASPFQTPLDIPLIANHDNPYGRDLDWQGNVVKSCVHCHQIGDGLKAAFREKSELLPLRLIYPMPAPETVGLSVAGDSRAKVDEVAPGSAAAAAGFQRGDEIVSVDGQWIISVADIAWALHQSDDVDQMVVEVNRGGQRHMLSLELAEGWRMKSDIARRVGTWPMRAMVGGGMKMEDLSDEERQKRGLDKDGLAFQIVHVGQYGRHAAAKRAGFLKDDILIEVDGITERLTESQYFGILLQRHPGKASLDAVVLRKGKRVELKFPMQ